MATIPIPAEALPIFIDRDINEVFEKVSSIIETSSKMGRDLVREYISTRGTAKSGKAGRIETGAMLKSSKAKRISRSRSETIYKFGMLNAPKYAQYQESGFRHNWTGEWVEGMFAVADAREAVYQDIVAGIKAIG